MKLSFSIIAIFIFCMLSYKIADGRRRAVKRPSNFQEPSNVIPVNNRRILTANSKQAKDIEGPKAVQQSSIVKSVSNLKPEKAVKPETNARILTAKSKQAKEIKGPKAVQQSSIVKPVSNVNQETNGRFLIANSKQIQEIEDLFKMAGEPLDKEVDEFPKARRV